MRVGESARRERTIDGVAAQRGVLHGTHVGRAGRYFAVTMPSVSAATVRLATPEDLDAVLQLERQAPTAAHWSRAQYEAILQPAAPSRLCLVAASKEVQAFLVVQIAGPEWELENIVVAPAVRGQGLGTLLLRALLERARQRHAHAVWLEVRVSNGAACALYRSCGFEPAGVRARYYREPEEDAALFTCKLE